MRILIVDDSKAMQFILRRGMEGCGLEEMDLQVAGSGIEALEIIREWQPELILSDWHMPEMTGIELLEAINEENLSTNVGFVTTETSADKVKLAKEAGAKFILNKPFKDDALHQAVKPFLSPMSSIEEEDPKLDQSKLAFLPSGEVISKILKVASKKEITVNNVAALPYHEGWTPCLLGLFSAKEEEKVRMVAIINFSGSCVLGASLDGLPKSDVSNAISDQILPKVMQENCKKILRVIGASLKSGKDKGGLQLRSVNLMPKSFPKIEQLFQKSEAERVDFEIEIPDYGKGNLTIIAS